MHVPASPFDPLLPWIDALCEVGFLLPLSEPKTIREVRETRIIWVYWTETETLADIEADDPEVLERAHEALEMLTILSDNGHYDAWAAFLTYVWPRKGPKWLDLLPSWRTDGLRIGCNMDIEAPTRFMAWAQKYVLTATSEASVARRALLRSLLAESFSIPEFALTNASPVPVHLGIYPNGAENRIDATTVLMEAASVTRLQNATGRSDGEVVDSFSPRFVLKELCLTDELEWAELQCVDEIICNEIRVTMLPICDIRLDESAATIYTPMLRKLFALGPVSNNSSNTNSCASGIELAPTMSRVTASAVFSALLDSQSIREVRLWPSTSDDELVKPDSNVWQWLALSVFSRHATNQVDSITIDIRDLTHRDVAAMGSLLREPNSLAAFFENLLPSGDYAVNATTFRLSDVPGKGPELSFGTDALTVRVVNDQREDWLGVLLPGYGRAWVPRPQCSLVPDRLRQARSSQCRAIREIGLHGLELSSLALALSLLRVIGGGVRHLRLMRKIGSNVKIPNDWYAEVCRACPKVEAFKLDEIDIERFDTFCDVLELARVRKLTLHLVKPDTVRLSTLFDRLADESRSITRHLTTLSVRVDVPNDTLAELQDALHRMLSSNRSLHTVDVGVYDTEDIYPPSSMDDSIFSRHYDGDRVRGLGGPLSLTAKSAFLSVAAIPLLPREKRLRPGDGDRGVLHAMGQLDRRVLTLIFEFAAHCKTRRVNVCLKI